MGMPKAPVPVPIPGRSDELLERAGQLAVLKEALAYVQRGGWGAMVRVCGEAGVGKTALLRSFCDEIARPPAVLWGTCDPLFTPRPFGPLFAIAEGTGGEFGQHCHRVQRRLHAAPLETGQYRQAIVTDRKPLSVNPLGQAVQDESSYLEDVPA